MPATPQQLLDAANFAFKTVAEGAPVDQVYYDLKTLEWLMKNKESSLFTGGTFSEKVRLRYGSNAQNIQGDDQLEYNSRNTHVLAPYQAYGIFDGFYVTEEDLRNKGLTITRDNNGNVGGPTKDDARIILDTMRESWEVLRLGKMQALSNNVLRDGTHDPKSPQGIDAIVSTTPSVGVIGGIDAATTPLWRNYASMAISTASAGNLIDQLEIGRRECMKRGKFGGWDAIFCGSSAYDAFRKDARAVQDLNVTVPGSGGVSLDPATKELKFHGVPVIWDPAYDALDDLLGAITYPWKKRIYGFNKKAIRFRPVKGRWMQKIIPEPVYNRLVHYYGMHSEYGISCRQRSANAVFSIA